MRAKKKKEEEQKNKTWLHSKTLSVDLEASPAARQVAPADLYGDRWCSRWLPCSEGGSFKQGPTQLKSVWACRGSPLPSRRHVAVGRRRSDEPRERNGENLLIINKPSAGTTSIKQQKSVLSGLFQATSHGVTPLGRLKKKAIITNSELWVVFVLVLFFFSAEAVTQPHNSDTYVQYI